MVYIGGFFGKFCRPDNGLAFNIGNVWAGKSYKFGGKRPRFVDGSYNHGARHSGVTAPVKIYMDAPFSFLRFFYQHRKFFLGV